MASDGDIVVFDIRGRGEGRCDGCGDELDRGRWIRVSSGPRGERLAHCMACAGLADLAFLPTGDAALTRRARARSARRGVVVRWARTRKRYERQGWLVEEQALEAAMAELRAEGREPQWELVGDLWVRGPRGKR